MRLSVPKELLNECSKKEIQLFLMILSKSDNEGICRIDTDLMCFLLETKKYNLSRMVSRLCDMNLIEKINNKKETIVKVVDIEKYMQCNYIATILQLFCNYIATISQSNSDNYRGLCNYSATILQLFCNYLKENTQNGQISDEKLRYYIDVLSTKFLKYNLNKNRIDIDLKNLFMYHSSNDMSVRENFTDSEKKEQKEETPNEQLSLFEKEEKTCGQKEEKISTKDILEYWNNKVANTGIKKISSINPGSTRERQTICRIKEYGIDKFIEAINNASGSAYLRGQSWFCYDWFVKPNNFPKVLENNYRDNNTNDNGNIQRERRWGFCGDVTEYDDPFYTDIECPGEQFQTRPTATDNPTDGGGEDTLPTCDF